MNLDSKFVQKIERLIRWFGETVLCCLKGKTVGRVLFLVLCFNVFLISLALLLPDSREDPSHHFGEFHLITFLSVFQLLTVSALSWQVYLERQKGSENAPRPRVKLHHLWFLITGGFAFLAIDELASVHELADKLIHFIGQIEETDLSDKIDDFIIALYGITAVGVLYCFRREFVAFRRYWLPFALAFFFLGLSVAFDLKLTNFLLPYLEDEDDRMLVLRWRSVSEEVFELISECLFIAALYGCVLEARRMGT